MAVLFRKVRPRRCYFCRGVGVSEASYTGICARHQALISLKFVVFFVRTRRWSHIFRLEKCVRWWG